MTDRTSRISAVCCRIPPAVSTEKPLRVPRTDFSSPRGSGPDATWIRSETNTHLRFPHRDCPGRGPGACVRRSLWPTLPSVWCKLFAVTGGRERCPVAECFPTDRLGSGTVQFIHGSRRFREYRLTRIRLCRLVVYWPIKNNPARGLSACRAGSKWTAVYHFGIHLNGERSKGIRILLWQILEPATQAPTGLSAATMLQGTHFTRAVKRRSLSACRSFPPAAQPK